LITVGATPRRIEIFPNNGSLPSEEVWRHTEDKFELAEPGITQVDQNITLTMAVTFIGVEIIQGESVTKILNQLCDLVGRTLAIIETAMLGCRTAQT
jgi:hypothetical protein